MPSEAAHRALREGRTDVDTNETTSVPAGITRRWLGAAGLIGAGLLAGGILAGSHLAGAATSGTSSSSTASTAATTAAASSGNANPATVRHGPGETLLTGTTASKVTAAAKAAVPGATIIRVETDSEGAAYEAHMRKADGSYVTVKLDKNFKVTSTIDGFGRGGPQGGSPGTTP
jgi:hypothetical protein